MSRLRRDDGASAIELSIVAPALLLLIFAAVQIALWLYGRTVAMQSAREGVSYLRQVIDGATVPSALAAAEITSENYARQVGRETVLDPRADATVLARDGQRVQITVEGRAISLVPGLTLRVRGHAEGEIEQFRPDR